MTHAQLAAAVCCVLRSPPTYSFSHGVEATAFALDRLGLLTIATVVASNTGLTPLMTSLVLVMVWDIHRIVLVVHASAAGGPVMGMMMCVAQTVVGIFFSQKARTEGNDTQ